MVGLSHLGSTLGMLSSKTSTFAETILYGKNLFNSFHSHLFEAEYVENLHSEIE